MDCGDGEGDSCLKAQAEAAFTLPAVGNLTFDLQGVRIRADIYHPFQR